MLNGFSSPSYTLILTALSIILSWTKILPFFYSKICVFSIDQLCSTDAHARLIKFLQFIQPSDGFLKQSKRVKREREREEKLNNVHFNLLQFFFFVLINHGSFHASTKELPVAANAFIKLDSISITS